MTLYKPLAYAALAVGLAVASIGCEPPEQLSQCQYSCNPEFSAQADLQKTVQELNNRIGLTDYVVEQGGEVPLGTRFVNEYGQKLPFLIRTVDSDFITQAYRLEGLVIQCGIKRTSLLERFECTAAQVEQVSEAEFRIITQYPLFELSERSSVSNPSYLLQHGNPDDENITQLEARAGGNCDLQFQDRFGHILEQLDGCSEDCYSLAQQTYNNFKGTLLALELFSQFLE